MCYYVCVCVCVCVCVFLFVLHAACVARLTFTRKDRCPAQHHVQCQLGFVAQCGYLEGSINKNTMARCVAQWIRHTNTNVFHLTFATFQLFYCIHKREQKRQGAKACVLEQPSIVKMSQIARVMCVPSSVVFPCKVMSFQKPLPIFQVRGS